MKTPCQPMNQNALAILEELMVLIVLKFKQPANVIVIPAMDTLVLTVILV